MKITKRTQTQTLILPNKSGPMPCVWPPVGWKNEPNAMNWPPMPKHALAPCPETIRGSCPSISASRFTFHVSRFTLLFVTACHGFVTALSRVKTHKEPVFIDLSRCHGSKGVNTPPHPLAGPVALSPSPREYNRHAPRPPPSILHPLSAGLPAVASGRRLVRPGTALVRLWYGSKMRKGPSLLAWDGGTAPGGVNTLPPAGP